MELPYIASLKHKKEIDVTCKEIKKHCGIDYLIIYLLFRNSQLFVLSNTYAHLDDYYRNGMFKHDSSTAKIFFKKENYYLCDNDTGISETYSNLLRNKYSVHRIFYKMHQTAEFDLILGAASGVPISDKLSFYKKVVYDYDNFVLKFIENHHYIFKRHNPELKNSLYFNNPRLLKKLFQNTKYPQFLSLREKQCLILTAKGYTSDKAAKELGISKHTVEEYKKCIIKKLNAVNMSNAIYLAMEQDLFEKEDKIPNIDSIYKFRNINI